MNKTTFKNFNIRLLLCCGFLIFTAVIIHSCKKDNKNQLQDTDITDPNVLAAQAWYNTSYPTSVTTSTGTTPVTQATQSTGAQQASTDWSKIISPYWSKAAAFTSKKGLNIVEAPALKKGDMAFARNMPANLSKYDFSQSGSLTSMLILKQGNQYAAYAMTIMGDSSYTKGDYSKLANNTYRKKDKDFTGWVLYHQLNGTFVNGWRYVNGQVTAAVHYNPGTATSIQAVQSISSPQVNVLQTCDITIVWEIFENCYTDDPTNCFYTAKYVGTYSTCTDVPTDPGGDPSAPPPPPPCVPQGGGSTAPAAVNGKTTLALKTNKQTVLVAQPTDPPPTDPNGEIVPVPLCPVNVTTVDTIKVDTVKDPCTQNKQLSINQTFIAKMNSLKDNLSGNAETGYTFTDISNANTYSAINGDANAMNINLNVTGQIAGLIHDHPDGAVESDGSPILSDPAPTGEDVKAIYTLLSNNALSNPSTFVLGGITSEGTAFSLQITNLSQFKKWAATNLTATGNNKTPFQTAIDNSFLQYYNNQMMARDISKILGFLDNLSGSGLSLSFANYDNLNNWQPVTSSNGTIVYTNCNN